MKSDVSISKHQFHKNSLDNTEFVFPTVQRMENMLFCPEFCENKGKGNPNFRCMLNFKIMKTFYVLEYYSTDYF